jgi:uncharacterized protein YcaQ
MLSLSPLSKFTTAFEPSWPTGRSWIRITTIPRLLAHVVTRFDNLICDRKRTACLFEYHYQSKIYTPKDKRRFGYYVMPILSGDQLIGRIDPTFDRSRKQLLIHAVHTEPTTAITGETGQAIAAAIEELAEFLGATTISYSHQLPEGWKQILS